MRAFLIVPISCAVLLLATSCMAQEPVRRQVSRVLLIGQGPDGHPAATHEYRAGTQLLAKLLSRAPGVQPIVVSADGDWSDGPEMLAAANAAVVFVSQGAKWIQARPERLAAFQSLAKRQGGLFCLHWGMGTREASEIRAFVDLFGGCHGGPDRGFKVVTVPIELGDTSHPILRGVEPLEVHEEFYYKLKLPMPLERHVSLVKAPIDGGSHTVAWAWTRPDGGRSSGFTGLHFHQNWRHEAYRRLVAQSILWTLDRDIPAGGLNVELSDSDLALPSKSSGVKE